MLTDTLNQNQVLKQDANGLLQFYDVSRSRWLSVTRHNILFGIDHKNIVDDRWFKMVGNVVSNASGYRVPRNCIVTCISVQSQNSSDCNIRVRKNDSDSNITSVTLSSESGKTSDSLNIELSQNDWVQLLLQVTSGNVDYPEVVLELAWRD